MQPLQKRRLTQAPQRSTNKNGLSCQGVDSKIGRAVAKAAVDKFKANKGMEGGVKAALEEAKAGHNK